MADQTPKKNAGVAGFLATLLRNESNLSKEVADLTSAVKNLSSDFTILSKSVASLAKIVLEHSNTINDLFTIQSYILQQLKLRAEDDAVLVVEDPDRIKQKKPN